MLSGAHPFLLAGRHAGRLLLIAAVALTDCTLIMDLSQSLPPAVRGEDAAADAADAELEDDAGEEDGDDRRTTPTPGPLTNVVQTVLVNEERTCDLDDDGDLDNAIADLGSSGSQVFAMFMSSLMQTAIDEYDYRLVMHMPLVDDLARPDDPDATGVVFSGRDSDLPPDATDDFSGSELFLASWRSLDGCGEPASIMGSAGIDDGAFHAADVTMPFLIGSPPVRCHIVRAEGVVAPGGARMEVSGCGYYAIQHLGGSSLLTLGAGLTALEALVAGGAALGYPGVPGLIPDLDLDHDGLERLLLDDDGRLSACLDGDGTLIQGRGCWADSRMNDAFSVVIEMQSVGARFGGPEPGWEDAVEYAGLDCPSPPDHSLWDPQ